MSRRDPNRNPIRNLTNFTPRPDRKTLQLCAQVKDALAWVLGSVSTHTDDVLLMCHVDAVEPLPGGNRMLVKVAVPAEVALSKVSEQLAEATSALRMEVAQAITRRKVPELVFLPVHFG